MNSNLIFLIFLLIFTYIFSNPHLRFTRYLPIKKEPQNITLEEFVHYRIENIYKTNIMLGDPDQDIPGFLNTNQHGFLISSNNCLEKKAFEKEKSKTFIYYNNNKTFSESFYFYTSYYSTNYHIEINNFTLPVNENMDIPFCFHIGTQLPSGRGTDLITYLHVRKFIKTYNYYFKIYSEDEVYLILDSIINDKDDLNYKYIKPLSEYYNSFRFQLKWGLIFEHINFVNSSIPYMNNIYAEFDINLGGFIGSFYFKDYFERYLREKKIYVQPKNYLNKYYIYFFDKKLQGIEDFKNIIIKFYHKELNCFFYLDFNDLFLEKENGYYFLIAFDWENKNLWKFGIPFFKKYNVIYNHDSKLMGFHISNLASNDIFETSDNITKEEKEKLIKINENKKNNNKIKKIIIFLFFVIIFFILLVLFFGILIGKKIFGVRKIKVNELLELYDYTSSTKK